MSINKTHLHYLLRAYMAGNITREELELLKDYVRQSSASSDLEAVIDELWAELETAELSPEISDSLYQKIINDPRILGDPPHFPDHATKSPHALPWQWTTGIAALLCIGFGLFLYDLSGSKKNAEDRMAQLQDTVNIIQPGGNKAMLTLADGRVIRLDEAGIGNLAEEAGIRIVKTADGKIFYEVIDNTEPGATVYNTISTPKGGEYQLILPDGTSVWLNAASSLRYPTHFTAPTREVDLTGEAYFEVSHERISGKPFIVKSATQSVEVLGTRFNVNAYENEKAKTTLLEGRVEVSANIDPAPDQQAPQSAILHPGQQSSITKGSSNIEVTTVDPLDALAWKNGYFIFQDEDIKSVMKIISRWYDIEVEYEGDMRGKAFGGTISRFESFEELLSTIALTGSIKFKIEGRRVIVMT